MEDGRKRMDGDERVPSRSCKRVNPTPHGRRPLSVTTRDVLFAMGSARSKGRAVDRRSVHILIEAVYSNILSLPEAFQARSSADPSYRSSVSAGIPVRPQS